MTIGLFINEYAVYCISVGFNASNIRKKLIQFKYLIQIKLKCAYKFSMYMSILPPIASKVIHYNILLILAHVG